MATERHEAPTDHGPRWEPVADSGFRGLAESERGAPDEDHAAGAARRLVAACDDTLRTLATFAIDLG